jgi:serine/threonine protein kinase
MAFATGMRIGKYELGTQLGEGGFGVVYRARDTGLDRDVALKFLHTEHTSNVEILQRFLQEARSAAKIVHPGIVTIYECGQVAGTSTPLDGTAFIAMEMLQGEPLSARLERSSRLPPSTVAEIGRQIASAVDAAHKAGVVHRDLKPDNVFLIADPSMPSGERVKILDFGIAKLGQATSAVKTSTAVVFGTPRYMSPEQCRSSANIDHRSDIYTLGVILFEMVTGRPVFEGESGELIAKHQLVDPPIASSLVALPVALDQLITSMLAKDPARRPQTMDAVKRAIEGTSSGSPAATAIVAGASVGAGSALPPTELPGQLAATPGSGAALPATAIGKRLTPAEASAAGAPSGASASSRSAAADALAIGGGANTTLSGGAGSSAIEPPQRRGRGVNLAVGVAVLRLSPMR